MRTLIAALALGATALALAPAASAATVPAPPASCSVTKVPEGHKVVWTASPNSGGSPITGYVVREVGYNTPARVVGATVREFVWEEAPRDAETVQFSVRARNKLGASQPCRTNALTPEVEEPEPPVNDASIPYSADSFFKSRVDGPGVPIDAARTSSFHSFMATHPDQKAITWPKVNVNPNWAMSYHVHKAGDSAPVWKLVGGNTGDARLKILTTQGFHMPDAVADTFPTGDQDRPGVMIDTEFGYTVQFADAVPNKATRTITVSNAGIMWHSSNGLDYRNPRSDDNRNFTSRGRILDAMVVRRDLLDAAVERGTGLGHVLHLFFVETQSSDGFVHPMVGDESGKSGWGAEGERLRLKPSVDLVARGITGHALALARTLQEHGTYLGDNSGSSTLIKASQPHNYVGTNIALDVFKGKISWTDFEVVAKGFQ